MNRYKKQVIYLGNILTTDKVGNLYFYNKKLKLHISDHGYLAINPHELKDENITMPIKVHRIVAYLKFGVDALMDGIDTRHLNRNKLDNSWNNIGIGTRSDNMQDIPKSIRMDLSKRMKAGLKIYYDNMNDENRAIMHKERSERAKWQWANGNIGRHKANANE